MSRRRISLADLLSKTGYEQRDLWELRPRPGLFPFKPEHSHVTGSRGSTSDYPIEALDYLRRLAKVQGQFPRKADEWHWSMWLDPSDWPIDICTWVLPRLDRMLDDTMRVKAAGAILKPGAERRSLGSGRVRSAKSRQAAWDWMVAWALSNERPELYSEAPEGVPALSFYDLFLSLMGPPLEGIPVFRFRGQREQLSERGGPYFLAHFRRIVALASDRDKEQARQDWRAIYNLMDAAERVDWNNVPAFVAMRAKPEPPSWAARRARRTRPKPPPDFIKLFIEEWRRSFDLRALLFSTLLTTRRLLSRAGMRQLPDVMLTIAQQWLKGLPQRQPATDPPEKLEAYENEHAC